MESVSVWEYGSRRICATGVAGNKTERPNCNARKSEDTRFERFPQISYTV